MGEITNKYLSIPDLKIWAERVVSIIKVYVNLAVDSVVFQTDILE